ncbi:MAG: YitT family protein [Mycoplasmataceae bacterium]|nr:YitT family protein [Mycoplasmataceae bacterium]
MKKEKTNFEEYRRIGLKFKRRLDNNYNGFFDFVKSNFNNLLIIVICAFFYAFGQVQFLFKAAVISDGVESISMSLSYLFPILKPFLTVLYLILNIPLILYYWKKIKKPFMVTTLIFLIFNSIFGYIFSIEPIDNFITHNLIVIVENSQEIAPNKNGTTNLVNSGWAVFVYVILAVACCSPSSAIVWKLGASTGGTDLIAYYFSTKKKKPVGIFLIVTGTMMSVIAIFVLFICKKFAPISFTKYINGFDHILGSQTFGTYLYILLNAFIINLIYPRYQKVKIRIDTKNVEEIKEFFKEINFWHPYQIKTSISGYTKEEIYSIESVVLLLESEDLALKIKENFLDVWISVVPVSKIYGNFNYSAID